VDRRTSRLVMAAALIGILVIVAAVFIANGYAG
jgi:hypothetical protein